MVGNRDISISTPNRDKTIFLDCIFVRMKVRYQTRILIVSLWDNIDDVTGAKLILGKTTRAQNRK